MRKIYLLMGIFLVLAIFATHVNADCHWVWLCDENSDCSYQPVCDSTTDIVPPRSPSIQPVVSPSIKPISTPVVPPVGTQDCYQARQCDSFANCRWSTVCY